MGLRRGENFWLRVTTANEQCLRLSERFFVYADEWNEKKPTLPDGTSPGLAVIAEGQLRRNDVVPGAADQRLSDFISTPQQRRQRRPRWFDGRQQGATDDEKRNDGLDATSYKRGPQSCISNCLQTDNMTFVRCRFLCR